MIGIVITVFGRPSYTRDCLKSLQDADLTNCVVCIVDDKSRCKITPAIIEAINLPAKTLKISNRKNMGVSASLLIGFKALSDCDILMNLDNDAVVKPNFVQSLKSLLDKFPDRVITGFNTETLNENGQLRHAIISDHKTYLEKASCGGVNMMFTRETYHKWVEPELKSSRKLTNWDNNLTQKMSKSGLHVISSKPSVVQHIGVNSTYKRRLNPDISADF